MQDTRHALYIAFASSTLLPLRQPRRRSRAWRHHGLSHAAVLGACLGQDAAEGATPVDAPGGTGLRSSPASARQPTRFPPPHRSYLAPARKIPLAHPRGGHVSNTVVSQAPPFPPADRFAGIVDGLCRAVAAQIAGGRLAGPLIILIWTRLRHIARRFGGIAARLNAGRLRRRAAPRRRPAQETPRPRRHRGPRPLPQGFAWLIRLAPGAAAGAASQLRHLLAEPDMAALIAAAPQTGRSLRSLCWMLGVRPPPDLPRRRRVPPAVPAAKQPPAAAPPGAPPPTRASPPLPPPPRACGPPLPV